MNLNIRKVEKTDNKELADIIRSCFHDFNVTKLEGTVYTDPTTDSLFELFQNENSVLLVAENEEGTLGCCGFFPTINLPEDCVELVKFYVSHKARGKGVGKMLLETTMLEAKKMGYQSIYLESLPEFSKAVSIYEKQGFMYLDQPLGNSGHTGCDLWMLKYLIDDDEI